MHLCESKKKLPADELTVLQLFDVHINIGTTLNLLERLCVIYGCRAVQTNSAETPLALLAM